MASKKTTGKMTANRTAGAATKGKRTAPRSAAVPMIKSGAVKTAHAKTRAPSGSAKSLTASATAAVPTWPQAMSSSGAVTAHAVDKMAKHARPNGSANDSAAARPLQSRPLRGIESVRARSETTASWLEHWGQMNVAAKLMDPDAVKAAMDRQFQLYQTMARFSPLTLALQMMQGLLTADARPSQPPASRL